MMKTNSLQSSKSVAPDPSKRAGFVGSCAVATMALAMSLASPVLAQGVDGQTVCTKGADKRIMEAVTPGTVGAACDLKYTRGGSVTTPYHANNQADFCAGKIAELVANLQADGFSCDVEDGGVIASLLREAEANQPALPPAPEVVDQDAPSETTAAELQEEATDQAASGASDETQDEEAQTRPIIRGEAPAEPVDLASAEPQSEPQSELEPNSGSERKPATDAPIYLTSVRPVAPARTTKIRNTAPATGRLTGAVPAEENLVMADQSAPQSNTTGPNASSVSASNPSTEKSALQNPLEAMRDKPVSKPRSSQDLIKAVLNAQAAAWNEGNLLAFMSGYWDSPDLRLVSGENVTRGYAKALKRYRSRYGDGAGMGNLAFQNLDVQMLDQDVAIVVGRYSLNRDADASTGSFSLVMRRFNGLWRIVHDHTSADPVVLAEQEG